MSRTSAINKRLIQVGEWIFIGLLAYMPLHIFLSTWLGSSFHILSTTRVLKDVILALGFLITLIPAIQNKWLKDLYKDPLVILITIYAALTVLLALIKPTDNQAELLGVVYNTRFLLFFIYGGLLLKLCDKSVIRRSLIAVMASAFIVLIFGIIQYTVLPNNALSHFGYTKSNGVLPAFFIDEKPDLERIMSTIRDPNSLGSYIIIIISLMVALFARRSKQRLLATGFILLGLLCLWQTFSRSAWIGCFVAIVVAIILGLKKISLSKRQLSLIFGIVAGFLVATGVIFYVSRNTYFVQNVIFHADESTVLEDPNQLRVRFWKESAERITNNPLGSGPGTAGIVSIRNKVQGGHLNENYYLQVGSEVGVIGLILFLAILCLVALRLFYEIPNSWLAVGLFASFIGLLITNFLAHIWSNEAVAYTWWGLAGLIIGTGVSKKTEIKRRTVNKTINTKN